MVNVEIDKTVLRLSFLISFRSLFLVCSTLRVGSEKFQFQQKKKFLSNLITGDKYTTLLFA